MDAFQELVPIYTFRYKEAAQNVVHIVWLGRSIRCERLDKSTVSNSDFCC
ncbi:MAG: hypothetical protein HFE68_05215 [Erysipelotrichaceae bacterium]|nr:hypothetical protein [Erysipelotrichaceae bacterium]MCI9312747.1 hypothetical protein [Erysipelotrichaceae bacterium]